MKNLWILFIALALAWTCVAEEQIFFETDEDFTIGIGELAYAIGIQATSRDDLIKYMLDNYGWKDETFIAITVGDYTEEYTMPDDVPMGSIYLMRGNWLIYYEQNKGYQDLWRGL